MSHDAGPSRGTVSSHATTAQPHQRPSSWSCDAARALEEMPRWLFLSACSGDCASASNVEENTASPSLKTGFLFVATNTFVRRYFLTGASGGGSGFSSRQDFVLSALGCATGKGYVDGGIDTMGFEVLAKALHSNAALLTLRVAWNGAGWRGEDARDADVVDGRVAHANVVFEPTQRHTRRGGSRVRASADGLGGRRRSRPTAKQPSLSPG